MFLSHSPDPEERDHPLQGGATATDRFLAVMRGVTDLFWILSATGTMDDISPSWLSFTGQQEREASGNGWLDVVYAVDRPFLEAFLAQPISAGQSLEHTCHIRRKDGIYRLIHLHVFPVYTLAGTICELVVSGRDITVEHMNDAQIDLALELSGVGLWRYDLGTQHFLATEHWKQLYGLPPDAPVTFESFLSMVHPDDHARIEEVITRARVASGTHEVQFRITRPDGSLRWLISRLQSIADAPNQSSCLIGSAMDITEVKEAEEQISQILESTTDAVLHLDRTWRITYANRRADSLTGLDWATFLGRSLWEVQPQLHGTSFEQHLHPAMETQQITSFEFFDPSTNKWSETHVYPTKEGLALYESDITEQKQAEEALRESEARFRALVDSNLIGIAVSDLEGTLLEANAAFLDLVGYTREDLAAGRMQWAAMTPPEYQEQHRQIQEELLATGKVHVLETEYQAKNGRRVPVLVGRTLFRREGSAPLAISFVIDSTARKEVERQKDLFLGMTSHELKTPLAALRATLQLVQRRLNRTITTTDHLSPEWSTFAQGLSKDLKDALHHIDVQTRLINDLLDISRIAAHTLELSLHPCDLVSIVRATVEDLRVTAPERVLLLDLPQHTMVNVLADGDRISQVITNYVTNALRYASPSQPIIIGLTIQEGTARVWVRDRGPGLTEEAKRHIWQPYHQVKGVPVQSGSGKGLGLGLSICQTLIAQHQGACGVESTPGEGSTFWFTLPIAVSPER